MIINLFIYKDAYDKVDKIKELIEEGYVLLSPEQLSHIDDNFRFNVSITRDVILHLIWESGENIKGMYGFEPFHDTFLFVMDWMKAHSIGIDAFSTQNDMFEKLIERYKALSSRSMEIANEKGILKGHREGRAINNEEIDKLIITYSPLLSYLSSLSSSFPSVREVSIFVNYEDTYVIDRVKRLGELWINEGKVEKINIYDLGKDDDIKEVKVKIWKFAFENKPIIKRTHPVNFLSFAIKSIVGMLIERENKKRRDDRLASFLLNFFSVPFSLSKSFNKKIIEIINLWKDSKIEQFIISMGELIEQLIRSSSMLNDEEKGNYIFLLDDFIVSALLYVEHYKGEEKKGVKHFITALSNIARQRKAYIYEYKEKEVYISSPLLNEWLYTIGRELISDLLPWEFADKIRKDWEIYKKEIREEIKCVNVLLFHEESKEEIKKIEKDIARVLRGRKISTAFYSKKHREGGYKKHKKVRINIKHFSYSQLELYSSCPYSYFFKYVLRLPSYPREFFDFGSIVHEALESILKGKRIDKVINEMRRKINESEVIDNKEYAVGSAMKVISSFVKRNSSLLPHENLSLEEFFSITFNGEKIIGFIDRVIRDKEGIKIIDYKTSKNAKSKEELRKDMQLSLYAHALSGKYKEGVKSIMLWYLLHDKIIEVDANNQNIDDVLEIIEERMNSIKEGVFAPRFDANRCRYCDYYMLCPIYNAFFYV